MDQRPGLYQSHPEGRGFTAISEYGQDTAAKRLAFYGRMTSGAMTTFNVDPKSAVTDFFASRPNFTMVVSHRDTQPSAEYRDRAARSFQRARNIEEADRKAFGERLHMKLGVFSGVDGKRAMMVATGNVTRSALEGRRRDGSDLPSQFNYYAVSEDPAMVAQAERVMAQVRSGKSPTSTENLLVTSPGDTETAHARMLGMIGDPNDHHAFYLTTATLSDPDMIRAIKAKAERGDKVYVKLGGTSDQDRAINERTLGRLMSFDGSKGGRIFAGFADGHSHANMMAMGDRFIEGSHRYSKAGTGGDSAGKITTELSFSGQNPMVAKDIASKVMAGAQFGDGLSKGRDYGNEFIDVVDKAAWSRGVQMMVPSQMSHEMRKMYEQTGITHNPNMGGVLSASYAQYITRAGYDLMGQHRQNFKFLQEVENAWFTEKTWGESWDQLGSRGLLSSTAINWVQKNTGFILTGEQVAQRAENYYITKPHQENTAFADTLRGAIDYFQNMQANLFGFYFVSTPYQLLAGKAADKFRDATKDHLPVLGKTFSGILNLTRYAAVDVSQSVFSKVAHAVDMLTGTGGHMTIQRVIDSGNKAVQDTVNVSTSRAAAHVMRQGGEFTTKHLMMRLAGVGLASDFFYGVTAGIRNYFGHAPEMRNTRLLWEPIIYDFDEAEKGLGRNINVHGGKVNWWRVGSGVMFGAFLFDKFTGYVGEHLGGVDIGKQERTNQILKEAAALVGSDFTPLQMKYTGNATRRGDWTDYVSMVTKVPVAGMVAMARDTWDQIFGNRLRDVMGPNVIYQGMEMEAARKAAEMGNMKLAAAYMIMSTDRARLYKDETFKADLWRSWMLQLTTNPLLFTMTYSMSEHRGGDGRSPFSHETQMVREYGVTLQGPITLPVGVSVNAPWAHVRELADGEDREVFGYAAWTTYFQPGSGFTMALGPAMVLDTIDTFMKFGRSMVTNFLDRALSPVAMRFGAYRAAGTLDAWSAWWRGNAGRNHAPMISMRGGKMTGQSLKTQVRIGAYHAAGRILMLPFTLPMDAARVATNVPLGLAEQTKWQGVLRKDMALFRTSDGELNRMGQIINQYKGERTWVDVNTRNMIRDHLILEGTDSLGLGSVEAFSEHMGYGEFGELSQADKWKARTHYWQTRSLMTELAIPNLSDLGWHGSNRWKTMSAITKTVLVGGRAGWLMAGGAILGLALMSGQNPATDHLVQANAMYNLANQVSSWSASATQEMRIKLNYGDERSWLYGWINENDSPAIFRGLLGVMKTALMFAAHPVLNAKIIGSGVVAEGILLPLAGFDTTQMKYDPYRGQWSSKDGAMGQHTGFFPIMFNMFKNLGAAFFGGVYGGGAKPYLELGPLGVVDKSVSPDRQEAAGWFSTFGPTMFMTFGYAEQFVFKEGWERRLYQQWKYARESAYMQVAQRQLFRDKAIRTGRMHHGDVLDRAQTWGTRLELQRRGRMGDWVRHVDAYDLLFVPGLVTKGSAQGIADQYNIRKWRDADVFDERLAELVRFFGSDFSEASSGTLEEADEELSLFSAVNDGRQFSDYFSRPYTMTPDNLKSNLLGTSFAKLGIVWGAVTVGVGLASWGIGGLVRGGAGALLTSAKDRIQIFGQMTEQQKIRSMRIPGSARRVTIVPHLENPMMPDPLDAIRVGHAHNGIYYVKGGFDPNAGATFDARDVFWTEAELKKDGMRNFMGAIEKLHKIGVNMHQILPHQAGDMIVTKSARLDQLGSVASLLKNLGDDMDAVLAMSPELGQMQHVKELVQRIKSGAENLEKVALNVSKKIFEDKAYDRMLSLALDKIHIDVNGQQVGVDSLMRQIYLDVLGADGTKARGATDILVDAMVKAGMLHKVGPEQTNEMRKLLNKLGLENRDLKKMGDVLYYDNVTSQQMGVAPDHGVSGLDAQPFMREARREFNARYISEIVQELAKSGDGQLLVDFQKGLLGMATDAAEESIINQMVEAALNPSRSVQISDADVVKLVEGLHAAGKITPEQMREMIDHRHKVIKARVQAQVNAGITSDFVTEGLRVKFLGKEFKMPSVRSALWGLAERGAITALTIAPPMMDMSYFSQLANDETLTHHQKQSAGVKAYEARRELIASFVGVGMDIAFTSGIMAGGAALATALIPALAGFTMPVWGTLLAGTAVSIGVYWLGSGIAKLAMQKPSYDVMAAEGRAMAHVHGTFGIQRTFLQWGAYMQTTVNTNMEKWSRQLQGKIISGKANMADRLWDVMINGEWNPASTEPVRGGFLRMWLDATHRNNMLAEAGGDDALLSIVWSKPGGSPSLLIKGQFQHSVLWIGNGHDLAKYMGSRQAMKIFDGPDGFMHDNLHQSTFGSMPGDKRISPDKDGSDPFRPNSLHDDFRSVMFRPPNLVQSMGLQLELKRRGDLNILMTANLGDQRAVMGHVVKTSVLYDPRSGGGMPFDAYLTSSYNPLITGAGFIQPLHRHPSGAQFDPGGMTTNKGKGGALDIGEPNPTLRGKVVHPRVPTPKVQPQEVDKKAVKTSAVPTAKTVIAMSAKEVQKPALARAVEVVGKQLARRVQQVAKVADPKAIAYVIPAAEPKKQDAHERRADTAPSRDLPTYGGTREAKLLPGGGLLIPDYLTFSPDDTEMHRSADTCGGYNRDRTDTWG